MLDDLVADEIKVLHLEFERWFHGQSGSLKRVEQALADDFLFVAPNGSVVPRADLLAGLRDGHGAHSFSIEIENVGVRWQRGDLVAATYEEWHIHDDQTTTRRSSVVMERDDGAPGGWRWVSVHETWITPPAAPGQS